MRAALAGIGLKDAHATQLLEGAVEVDFLEVHAENLMVAGGPRLRRLERLRERLPLSIHGVGLSIGGQGPLNPAHLDEVAALLARFEPRWVSEHLAWSSHGGVWLNDLLPVPYDRPTLDRVCEHIDQVQARMGLRILLENPSTYL
ncbi:MAG: multinuclear nonheme iron-dependent oxidase, partial [Rubrivivax sp.]